MLGSNKVRSADHLNDRIIQPVVFFPDGTDVFQDDSAEIPRAQMVKEWIRNIGGIFNDVMANV